MKITAEIQPADSFGASVFQRIDRLIDLFEKFVNSRIPLKVRSNLMFIVKDSNPDVKYSLSETVTDEKGATITDPAVLATLKTVVTSDNPDAVMITPDADPKTGTVHFGKPGLANLNVTTSKADGTLLGSFGGQVTVTTGDPAAITGGKLTLAGLTDQ